jgi:hypothetical protein
VKDTFQNKFLSLILAFSLLLPMVMSFSHSLHEHDQVVCMAENENHIHTQAFDCDHEHFFSPGGIYDQPTLTRKVNLEHDPNRVFGVISFKYLSFTPTCSLRGPPMINV